MQRMEYDSLPQVVLGMMPSVPDSIVITWVK